MGRGILNFGPALFFFYQDHCFINLEVLSECVHCCVPGVPAGWMDRQIIITTIFSSSSKYIFVWWLAYNFYCFVYSILPIDDVYLYNCSAHREGVWTENVSTNFGQAG